MVYATCGDYSTKLRYSNITTITSYAFLYITTLECQLDHIEAAK